MDQETVSIMADSIYNRAHPTTKVEEQEATGVGYAYGELNVSDIGEWESKKITPVPMGKFKIKRVVRYDDGRLSRATYERMGKPYPKEPIWVKTKVDIALSLEDAPFNLLNWAYVMIDCEFGAGRYVIESSESSHKLRKGELKSRSSFDCHLYLVNPLDEQLCTKPWQLTPGFCPINAPTLKGSKG